VLDGITLEGVVAIRLGIRKANKNSTGIKIMAGELFVILGSCGE